MCLWCINRTCNRFPALLPFFQLGRQSFLININKIDESILKRHELITKAPWCDYDKFDLSCNESFISSTIEFIVSSERFSNSLAILKP